MPKLTYDELKLLHGEQRLFVVCRNGDALSPLEIVKAKTVRARWTSAERTFFGEEYYIERTEADSRRGPLVLKFLKSKFQTLVNKAAKENISREQLLEMLKEG